MRAIIVSLLFSGAAVVAAAALSPKALDYLKELGIDPDSAEVNGIVDDQVVDWTGGGSNSLDDLATRRFERGVREFIATRNFIKKYLLNTKTPFPPNEAYEVTYLKPEELQFIRTALGGKLQPKAAAYLRERGIDPESEQITLIQNDQVGMWSDGVPYSLDLLALYRDKMGVQRFIATRNFVRKYMKDPKTPFPPSNVYHTSFLKEIEVEFIIKELNKASGK